VSRQAERAVVRLALRGERVRLGVIGAFVVLYGIAQVVGYRRAYPTEAARRQFARAFSDSLLLRLFYGIPRDLASVGGYVEFRVVNILAAIVAGWGVFAAVRALRGEEEAGRAELVLAGAVTRRGGTVAAFVALGACTLLLWLLATGVVLLFATTTGDVSARAAVLVGLTIALPGALFVAVGALASQLAATAHGAQAIGGGALAGALALRIVADLAHGAGALRWATPLGWVEQTHPVSGVRLLPPALLAAVAAVLLVAVATLAGRRDVGTGLAGAGRARSSRTTLLSSPTAATLRLGRGTLVAWFLGCGIPAVLVGAFAKSTAEEARRTELRVFGDAITTATAYLGLVFVFLSLFIALFASSRIGAIREEEASGRVETLLAQPLARRRWLGGQLALAAALTLALGAGLGVLAWAAAAAGRAGVGLGALVAAGLNCVPAALLFLALGALLFASVPRASGGGALALVGVGFLWQTVGDLVGAPGWLLSASPFDHVAAVPTHPFDTVGAAVMLAVAAVAAVAALELFARRDLQLA
jgi:ABC-2 type transport system permease protein